MLNNFSIDNLEKPVNSTRSYGFDNDSGNNAVEKKDSNEN